MFINPLLLTTILLKADDNTSNVFSSDFELAHNAVIRNTSMWVLKNGVLIWLCEQGINLLESLSRKLH